MRYTLLFFIALFVISCDNELELIAEKKEIPVVYSLLDQADTAQYIRVERIFVDDEIKPKDIAINPDSLYYEDITVKLVTENGQEYELERVDGNLEGYEREDGAFATAPNYLYKILTSEIPLVKNKEVRLSIEGIFEDRAVTSSTTILEPPFLSSPQNGGKLSFLPRKSIGIGWNPKDVSEIFTVSFKMYITETTSEDMNTVSLTWTPVSIIEDRKLEGDGVEFYTFLDNNLVKDASVTRTLDSIELQLIAGSEEIADYIRVGRANLGITSSGEVPVFSNLNGGLGVFGAKHTTRRTGLQLTSESKDSLINSTITRDLNFK